METGYELIDAMLNNPLQTVILFGVAYFLFKFFCSCNGFFAECRRDLKHSIMFELEWKLEKLDKWLTKKDKNYQEWKSRTNDRKINSITFSIISSIFIPCIAFVYFSGSEWWMPIVLIAEYIWLLFVSMRIGKQKRENLVQK